MAIYISSFLLIKDFFVENKDAIIASIIATFIFIHILFIFFRPFLIISDNISKDGEIYKFKLINLTFIKITDVNFYLKKVKELDAYPKGKDIEYDLLKTKNFIYIPGLITGIFDDIKSNCIQVKFYKEDIGGEDIYNIIKEDGKYIELIVTAKHGLSNLKITKSKVFKHASYVKKGKFKSGFSFKIVNTKKME